MSETYTAVYARDGEEWVARISGTPGLETRAASVGEVREQIREDRRHVFDAQRLSPSDPAAGRYQ